MLSIIYLAKYILKSFYLIHNNIIIFLVVISIIVCSLNYGMHVAGSDVSKMC